MVHNTLTSFVFFVDFSGGAYIYYNSGPTIHLFILYTFFILTIIYIIIISHNLIDHLLLIVLKKYSKPDKEPDFEVFKRINKFNFQNFIYRLACFFITICMYPIAKNVSSNYIYSLPNSDITINILAAIVSVLLGIILYVRIFHENKENKNKTGSKQKITIYKKISTFFNPKTRN